jgi:hypothetical protein
LPIIIVINVISLGPGVRRSLKLPNPGKRRSI